MGLEELATFIEAVEAGSLVGAARILGVPKSTVSRRLRRLEGDLGQELVQRHSRLFRVTEAGAALHRRSVAGVRELQQALRHAESDSNSLQGDLSLTLPQDMGTSARMMEVLASFCRAYPEIRLEVHPTDRHADLLADGFDFALRIHTESLPDSHSIKVRRLGAMQTGLFAAPSYLDRAGPLEEPEDLAVHQCVSPMFGVGGPAVWRLDHAQTGERRQIRVHPTMKTSSMSSVPHAAVAGLGIAPVPPFHAIPLVEQGALVQVLPDWAMTGGSLSLLWPASSIPSPRRRAFVDHLVSQAPTLLR